MRDNAEVVPADAEEVVIYIKRSKADQYVGRTRNHYATGRQLCPVAALQEYWEMFTERRCGEERLLPLLRYADGGPVRHPISALGPKHALVER